jgi:hypothetical protein
MNTHRTSGESRQTTTGGHPGTRQNGDNRPMASPAAPRLAGRRRATAGGGALLAKGVKRALLAR